MKRRLMSLCLWKEEEEVNSRGRKKDRHKNQIQINIFVLWKMKGVVERKSKKSGGGRTRQQRVYVGVMRSLRWAGEAMGSRAYSVDTARRLSPFTSALFKAREGNAEVHSHYIQTIQCQCKATLRSAMKTVLWCHKGSSPPIHSIYFCCRDSR